jgi:hypothetical protein
VKTMTLYKFVRDDVTKYSFVTRTKFEKAIFTIYYTNKEGIEKFKNLPYRTTRDQLITALETIKKDSDYYERKKKENMILKNMKDSKGPLGAYLSNGEKNGN